MFITQPYAAVYEKARLVSGRRQAYVHKHQTNVHAKITQEHLHDLKGFMKPILPGKEHRIETLSYFLNTITSNWYNMAPASLLLTGYTSQLQSIH